MSNVVKAIWFAGAAFLWFPITGRVLLLSRGFAGLLLWLVPRAPLAIVALGYGVQATADAWLGTGNACIANEQMTLNVSRNIDRPAHDSSLKHRASEPLT